MLRGQTRMDLHARLGIDIDQPADAARLRAGKILAHDAAGGQIDGEVVRYRIAALAPFRNVETALAVRIEGHAAFEQSWRTGVIEFGAWPEYAELFVDSFVGDAVVVGDAAARGLAQLIEEFRASIDRGRIRPSPTAWQDRR